MQQQEDSRGYKWVAEGRFQLSLLLSTPLLSLSVIIHTRVLLYGLAFSEMVHCASVYELTSPLCPPENPPSSRNNSTVIGGFLIQYNKSFKTAFVFRFSFLAMLQGSKIARLGPATVAFICS